MAGGFTARALEAWLAGDSGAPGSSGEGAPEQRVVVDPRADAARRPSILRLVTGASILAVSGNVATELGVAAGDRLDESRMRAALHDAGFRLNDPDHVFLLSEGEQRVVADEQPADGVRALGPNDTELFDRFVAGCPEDDVDEAFVELDHWAVVGRVVDGELVAAASAYPWRGGPLADIGVITHPAHRGRGHAVAVVRALARTVIERDHEPQYRCQLDNVGSVRVAHAARFTPLGEWEAGLPPA